MVALGSRRTRLLHLLERALEIRQAGERIGAQHERIDVLRIHRQRLVGAASRVLEPAARAAAASQLSPAPRRPLAAGPRHGRTPTPRQRRCPAAGTRRPASGAPAPDIGSRPTALRYSSTAAATSPCRRSVASLDGVAPRRQSMMEGLRRSRSLGGQGWPASGLSRITADDSRAIGHRIESWRSDIRHGSRLSRTESQGPTAPRPLAPNCKRDGIS